MTGGLAPLQVSVVVPCYRGADDIGRCLDSLGAQTLPPSDFEVVVVLNGPADGADEVVRRFRADHPELRVRLVESPAPGAGRARNLGIAIAAGAYVTFVDHDDYVSPAFLATLLDLAAPGVIPLAQVADVAIADDGTLGEPSFDNYIAEQYAALAGEEVRARGNARALGFNAAKLLPVAVARSVRFDEDMASGEDVVYWHQVATAYRFRISVSDPKATYFRVLRPGSVSRREHDYTFGVAERLDVIARLDAPLTTGDPHIEYNIRRAFIGAQSVQVGNYLAAHPEDATRLYTEIDDRGIGDRVSWPAINGRARDLAVLYAFAPYADTSALVAGRRLRARGDLVDVISNNLDAIRGKDEGSRRIIRPFVSRHRILETPTTALEWGPLREFCELGMEVVEGWVEEQGPYRSVYTRAMLPGSHLLGALIKLRHPEIHWLAEFSDPIIWNPYGQRRVGKADNDDLWRRLSGAVRAAGIEVPKGRNVATLTELVAFAMADEILFTNEHQMEFMLDQIGPEVADKARPRCVWSHHPVPAPELYELAPCDFPLDETKANIAYFGAFWPTRGLTEVADALNSLDAETRGRLAFHVFSSDADTSRLRTEIDERGVGDVIHVNGHLPYLECLNLATRADVLMINDAHTRQHYTINPYLPSKWADYVGCGKPVWAHVEPGSVLDGMDVAHKSELSDVAGVRQVLEAIAARAQAKSAATTRADAEPSFDAL